MPRHLAKPRSMKLRSFISSLQEVNALVEDFPPDIEGQQTAPLPADEITHHLPFHANHVETHDD